MSELRARLKIVPVTMLDEAPNPSPIHRDRVRSQATVLTPHTLYRREPTLYRVVARSHSISQYSFPPTDAVLSQQVAVRICQ
jgi:hypothetical protein